MINDTRTEDLFWNYNEHGFIVTVMYFMDIDKTLLLIKISRRSEKNDWTIGTDYTYARKTFTTNIFHS